MYIFFENLGLIIFVGLLELLTRMMMIQQSVRGEGVSWLVGVGGNGVCWSVDCSSDLGLRIAREDWTADNSTVSQHGLALLSHVKTKYFNFKYRSFIKESYLTFKRM